MFVVPAHDELEAALAKAGIDVDRCRFWDGHYHAMHAVDAAQSPAETFDDYVTAFCHHLDLHVESIPRAIDHLRAIFGPSRLWREPVPDTVEDFRALAGAGVPMAIVSNADGTVASHLGALDICQVGAGPAVEVATIVDSGAIGVAKPDPATFTPAVEALGLPPSRIVHVGDSVHYDIEGARAAGLQAVHFDPRRLCRATDHPHITRLAALLP